MIPVKFDQLLFSNMGFVILLKEEEGRTLPIFIGAAEARAIALYMKKIVTPRPLTHDLLKNILDYLECRIKRVEVCDLKEGTFYAKLVLERDGIEMEIDSRPSDAIALARLASAPIFVAESVMDEAGGVSFAGLETEIAEQKPADQKPNEEEAEHDQLTKLKKELEKAVEEERYEDAARIKKEIERLEGYKKTDN